MSTRIKKSRVVLVGIILIAGVSVWGYSVTGSSQNAGEEVVKGIHTLLTNFEIRFPDFIVEIKRQGYYNEPEIKKAVLKAEKLAESALTISQRND